MKLYGAYFRAQVSESEREWEWASAMDRLGACSYLFAIKRQV